jgi:hypothetical protein
MVLLLCACPGATPTTTPTGLKCAQHADCASLAEGYCAKTGVCTRECSGGYGDAGCPDGSACVGRSGRQVCLSQCSSTVTCLAPLSCVETDAGALCDLADPLVAPPAPAK